MMTTRKYGRRPAYTPAERPRLRLGPALVRDHVVVPSVVDELSKVDEWPMYLNDRIGDCTVAAAGHMIEVWSAYGQGVTVKVSDQDVLTGYSAVSGYNPRTGANDDGCVMQDVLDYWRKTGIGGHRILAFAEVDVANPAEISAALYLFGHVYVGLDVPYSAENQFAAGQPWDTVANDGGIAGGHAVDLGFNSDGEGLYKVVTWGAAQQMTNRFWHQYVREAWVVADADWVSRTGGSPPGLDVANLNAQFTALTGQPGPFTAPTPSPTPGDADRALAAALRRNNWVTHPHIAGNHRVAVAGKAWLAAHPEL